MAEKGKKEMNQGAPSAPSKQKQNKYGQQQVQRGQEQKRKDLQETAILWYEPANNFVKFQEAILKAAMKEYGNLGKLIKLGE
jgi:hypothetical protein